VAIIAVFLTAIFGIHTFQTAIITGSDSLASVIASNLIELTNKNRQFNNQPLLSYNPVLEQAAQQKANDMAKKGYFAHTSPEGLTSWSWFDRVGYIYAYAGENLAIDFQDSIDVSQAWMNSPTHRANIINPVFTEIGIATAQGKYQGRDTVFVVQMFAKPLTFTNSASVASVGISWFTQLLTSPNSLSKILLAILITITTLCVLLLFIIEASRRQYKEIMTGLLIIVIMISMYLLIDNIFPITVNII
jgi:uncharacterized protein YkwD